MAGNKMHTKTEAENTRHKTVLLKETIDGLGLKNNSTVIDATFGGGGHSAEICKRYPNAKIIALDQDNNVFERAKGKFTGCDITFVNKNFRDLDVGNVDGIIFDLGLSSDQLENSGRGFSFLKPEPLIMQMRNSGKENPSGDDLTAEDVVNTWSEKSLADIIYGYGEEKFSRRIARGIVQARKKSKIETTFDLVGIIEDSVPAVYKRDRIHFATRTFQALRIAVNDELGALSAGLTKGFEALKVNGRIAVISFHSLEDRVVKKFFKEKAKNNEAILISKKPITASKEELKNNHRARSAKLRIIEKTTAKVGQVK